MRSNKFINNRPQGNFLTITALIIVVGIVGYFVLNAQDQRGAGEKVDDAFDQLKDRSPGEKLGDAVKDVGDDIKDATNN